MYVYLLKDYVKSLDTDALLTYVALRILYHESENEMYVSINQLCYKLLGHAICTRTFKDMIVSGFDKLVTANIIKINANFNKAEFIVDLSKLYFKNEFFVKINIKYIQKVCNCHCMADKGFLLKYLLIMVGTFNNAELRYENDFYGTKKGFVGYMSISYIAKETGISEQTALSYNEILEQEEIIFVYRRNYVYQDEDGSLKTIHNNYGLFEDKEDIIKFADNYDEMQGFVSQTELKKLEDGNRKRSLAAKYRGLCNGVEYSPEEVQEIYDYVHEKNEYLRKQINEKVYKWEDLVDQLRDESVFKGII